MPEQKKEVTDPVSETLCFLFVEIRTMDKVQKLNSNEYLILIANKTNKQKRT
jgi:hypothetical protein